MAILRLSIGQSEPCIFAIFKLKIFEFWIFIEELTPVWILIRCLLPISSEIELGLGPFQNKFFLKYI
jgi:hypothetical protein